MEKFTVYIDLSLEEIKRGYANHFGPNMKKPTRKDLASWIGSLAEGDIQSAASHHDEDEEHND